MKRIAILCALALSLFLLAGCQAASPEDEEFQEDWEESMEAPQGDLDEDGFQKEHDWKILDASDQELGTVTDPKQVEALDELLSDDENWERDEETPNDGAYSYVLCQQETLKAGQKEEDLEYVELMRFTVSESEDAVTMVILADLPSLPNVDLEDILTFTMAVPAETADALRDPGRFLE